MSTEKKQSKQQEESATQAGRKNLGPNLFKKGLEKMLGEKLSDDEAAELDWMLSGVDPRETEEEPSE